MQAEYLRYSVWRMRSLNQGEENNSRLMAEASISMHSSAANSMACTALSPSTRYNEVARVVVNP